MTRADLAQALREEEQRLLNQMSEQELIQRFNTCEGCGSQILNHAHLSVIVAQAETLSEFQQLFDEARERVRPPFFRAS
jgi:hypothetical protein